MAAKPLYVIKIDRAKCPDAANCRICVDNCPGAVFTMYPETGLFMTAGAAWRVNATFVSLCTGCMACRRECPKGAIVVEK